MAESHKVTRDEMDVIAYLLHEVCDERRRQLEMWGQQDHPVTFERGYWCDRNDDWHDINDSRVKQDTLTWDGILMEEVAEALMETDLRQQRKEFIEVAAVAIAAAEAVDRKIAQQEMNDKWNAAMDDTFPNEACGENVDCTSICCECVTMGEDEDTDWLWGLKHEGEPEKPRKAGTITFDVQANIQPFIEQVNAFAKAVADAYESMGGK